MENDIYDTNSIKNIQKGNAIKNEKIKFFIIIYIFKILIIILCFTFIIFTLDKTKTVKKKINKIGKVKINNEISNRFKNNNRINCISVKNRLKQRTQPFEYEDELFFIINLIECNIPFSLSRFADGENSIMKGEELRGIDKWHWNPKNKIFRDSLIESVNICNKGDNFIGIPCKNWNNISNSILSFSNCTSSKYMTYSTVFTNYNFKSFQKWVLYYINLFNRRRIILVANSVINKKLDWVYKFFPIPTHLVENWDKYSLHLIPQLTDIAKLDYLIFFISAGPASNIIISHLNKINNKNIYIDFGSSIEFMTKGYSTRSYYRNSISSLKKCESFIIQNQSVIYE